MNGIWIKRRKSHSLVLLLLCSIFMIWGYCIDIRVQYIYIISIIIIYLSMMPTKLLNPKNVVFGFYFMWYGIAPLLSYRYANIYSNKRIANIAFLMLYFTYSTAMMTLEVYEGISERKTIIMPIQKKKLSTIENGSLLLSYFVAISLYIYRTGGLSKWLSDANDAFFSRGGSGFLYLIFEYAMLLILFYQGKNSKLMNKIPYAILCVLTMYFCGSKSIALMFPMMFFCDKLMNLKLVSRYSIFVIGCMGLVFVIGMYIRNGAYMSSLREAISTCMYYFDTLDQFLLSLKDFPPSFGKTIALPLNWIIGRLGYNLSIPYHDTSIWLTTIYYPEAWAGGGTHQWPIETYLYLNFHYIFGLPIVVIYFIIIGYIYKKAIERNGIWRFMYIIEMLSIISHLRGGLFNYWYIYLVPFYVILFVWERKLAPIGVSVRAISKRY